MTASLGMSDDPPRDLEPDDEGCGCAECREREQWERAEYLADVREREAAE